MNQHTAKLLKKYASEIDQDFRQVKKWWETLDWKQRTAWRNKIENIVEGDDEAEVEEVTEETATI